VNTADLQPGGSVPGPATGTSVLASQPAGQRYVSRLSAGFSYVEVLIATVLIAMSLVPALEALQTGLQGSSHFVHVVEDHNHMQARLEEVLAEPIDALEAAALAAGSPTALSSYSDPPATARRLLVYVSRYDGDDADSDSDPFTGTDAGLLWVRVEIDKTALSVESLVTWVYSP
jgi:hypothetical protein